VYVERFCCVVGATHGAVIGNESAVVNGRAIDCECGCERHVCDSRHVVVVQVQGPEEIDCGEVDLDAGVARVAGAPGLTPVKVASSISIVVPPS